MWKGSPRRRSAQRSLVTQVTREDSCAAPSAGSRTVAVVPIYALGSQEPSIAADADVHPDAVVIGSVTIGSQSSVWPGAVLFRIAGAKPLAHRVGMSGLDD